MNLFRMKGAWNPRVSWLYDTFVARGICGVYDEIVAAQFSNLPPGTRVLDLGCGSGQGTLRVAQRNPEAQVLGVDLSPSQIGRAEKSGAGVANLSYLVGDAMNLPLPDERFDLVLSVASIKHWPDPLRGLREMVRVCRPGGQLCVIEISSSCTHAAVREFVRHWRYIFPGTHFFFAQYFRRFVAHQGIGADEMRALLPQAGFAEAAVQPAPCLPLVIGRGVRVGA